MTIKAWSHKRIGCSKICFKREVYSNTIIPQETRKTLNRQLDSTPKTTVKSTTTTEVNRRKEHINIQTEIIEKEIKEAIVNINKTKSCSSRKKKKNHINKIRNAKGEVTTDIWNI